MKKSLILLISICLSVCLIFTACSQISPQDTTSDITSDTERAVSTEAADSQNDPSKEALAQGTLAQGTIFLHTEEDVDLSGVKVTISRKINIVVTGGLTSYSVEDIGSAISDSDGKIVYELPTDPFVIRIELDSLPEGMGVTKSFLSYSENDAAEEVTVELHKIVSVEAYFAYDNLNFISKNADSANVHANYAVQSCQVINGSSPNATPDELAVQYQGDIDFKLTHSGYVSVNGVLFPYSADRTYSDLDYPDYVSLMFENDFITEDEKTQMMEKFYETDYGKSYHSGGCFH